MRSSARVFLICLTDYGKVRHRYGCLGGHAGWKRRHGAERRYAFSPEKENARRIPVKPLTLEPRVTIVKDISL